VIGQWNVRSEKQKMAVDMGELIAVAAGFIMLAIVFPIGMGILTSVNSTFGVAGTAATYASVYTIFTVLLPVIYLIGAAVHFIPKIGKQE
jgi:uncharacterized RDD family membrane protein YckC